MSDVSELTLDLINQGCAEKGKMHVFIKQMVVGIKQSMLDLVI